MGCGAIGIRMHLKLAGRRHSAAFEEADLLFGYPSDNVQLRMARTFIDVT